MAPFDGLELLDHVDIPNTFGRVVRRRNGKISPVRFTIEYVTGFIGSNVGCDLRRPHRFYNEHEMTSRLSSRGLQPGGLGGAVGRGYTMGPLARCGSGQHIL